MRNILEKIVANTQAETAEKKELYPQETLTKTAFFERPVFSFKKALKESPTGIIAEFKRKSPSKGIINDTVKVRKVTTGYVKAGATALSVLTDKVFFGGKIMDLLLARNFNSLPILRKDFIVEEYQVLETKAIGADALLLIAACLKKEEVRDLSRLAKSIGLEVILEIHSETELDWICDTIDVVGVNNRDLKTFSVDLDLSLGLVDKIPNQFAKISESGIHKAETIVQLKKAGFDGFLIGENFMKTPNPDNACEEFIERVGKYLEHEPTKIPFFEKFFAKKEEEE